MPVPGLMSFEEWKAKAKENAQKNGEVWYEENAPGDYERYVWHAEHPQGDSSILGKGGTGTDEQRSTGAMPAGTFPDDHPDAGNANTGDPYIDELRSGRVAGSEDWRRFSNAQLKAWQQYYVGGGQFKNKYGDLVGKPIDSGPNTPQGYNGSGEPMSGGGGGGGGGGAGGAFTTNAPTFNWEKFVAPSWDEVTKDPGYQFRVQEGRDALQRSQAAQGLTRTGGSLKDLIGFSQDMAANEYQNAYNRALQGWGANYQGAKDQFAPLYGAWQTQYAGDLSKWTTKYGGELQKYLQKEQNIYGLLNPSFPQY